MPSRDDLLRTARILEYDRFYTPTKVQLATPGFEYEYVSAAVHKRLDSGGFCITWQHWMKAITGTAFDPYISKTDMEKKMQYNEVRARRQMNTIELRTLLETSPLKFAFDNGLRVVVLPKLNGDPNKVYVQWDVTRDLWVEQRAINHDEPLYLKWFPKGELSEERQDWRYLLQLNNPDDIGALNVLYKYFSGIYITDDIDFRLIKGTEIYVKEHPVKKPTRIVSTPRVNYAAERQKQVCIKDPVTGVIIRKQQQFTKKLLDTGWTFASKEEYKVQQKKKFEKRKDMAEGNREADMLKYKPTARATRRDKLKRRRPYAKGVAQSPYWKFQTIKIEHLDEKKKVIVSQRWAHSKNNWEDIPVAKETIRVKVVTPKYEYVPVVWEVWSYKEKEFISPRGKVYMGREKVELLETIPFLNDKGEPIKRRRFIETVEEWIPITRDVKTAYETIKVLQIPSKKMQSLKQTMDESYQPTPESMTRVLPVVRTQRAKYLLSEDKTGKARWRNIYAENRVDDYIKKESISA
jgi:hypothetical protein